MDRPYFASKCPDLRALVLLVIGVSSLGSLQARADESLPSVPQIHCPLYVMEYHVWYRSPFGHGPQPGYLHWGDPEFIDSTEPRDAHVRNMGAIGYPLLGLYDSENEDVIRWQLRCAHNAGIDGLFVQLFPDRVTGTYLGGSQIFATVLRLAGEEGVKVAAHDEVMFRDHWKAQQPDVMAVRISDFIDHYGSDPAYLKIGGHPVYAFQYWNKFMPPEEMVKCLDHSQELAGTPIHFFILGDSDLLYQRPAPSSFISGGNSSFTKDNEAAHIPDASDWTRLKGSMQNLAYLQKTFPGDKFGVWGYAGFNDLPQAGIYHNSPGRGFSRQNGATLAQVLTSFNDAHPDFILLGSWNDWMENTALEPGYRFDASTPSPAPDPYRYLRMLAAAKGLTFQPPPLPPKEAVDPLMWSSLYGIDATPPVLKSTTFSADGTQVRAAWSDSGHAVSASVLMESGDASIDFLAGTAQGFQAPSATEAAATTPQNGFLLTKKTPLVLHPAELAANGALSDWYVALQYQAQGPVTHPQGFGPLTIQIGYPADPPALDYRELDGLVQPAVVLMRPGSSLTPRTEVSLLRCANFPAAKDSTITLSLSNDSPEAGVYLRRLDLFHALGKGISGLAVIGARTDPGVETAFSYQLPAKPTVVFLFARDARNNWTAPQVLAPAP